ncbi:hypothetical protein [Brevibacterium album]|uniref:hypothetical protein n=1 Tax=Brevibacterium album TaxID=417948 RepID=UPI0004049450|nr:hypothetical protein [Brevibacterium album]
MVITPVFLLGIALAALGAILLAVGTHMQHSAVTRERIGPGTSGAVSSAGASPAAARSRSGVRLAVLMRPLWLLGTGLIVAETVLNVLALGLAPVALIQPLGALSLVTAVLISAGVAGRSSGSPLPLTRGLCAAIAVTLGAVAVFVGISARYALTPEVTPARAGTLTALLLLGSLAALLLARSPAGHLPRVAGAGMLFGGVATGAHLLAVQVFSSLAVPEAHGASESAGIGATLDRLGLGDPDPFLSAAAQLSPAMWALLVSLVPASAAGMWLVQTSYASGPPETVLAGLTVIDPLTAVGLGGLLLGEYAPMPPAAVLLLVLSALAAVGGIGLLSRHHPRAGAPTAAAPETAPAATIPAAPSASPTLQASPAPRPLSSLRPAAPAANIHAAAPASLPQAPHGVLAQNRRH